MNWLPCGLLAAWFASLLTLAGAVVTGMTGVVQAIYVLIIILLVVTLVASVFASAAVALNRFDGYWRSGFPILLAVFLLGYGLYKTTLELAPLALDAGGFLIGALLALAIKSRWLRFAPAIVTILLLAGSEIMALPIIWKAVSLVLYSGIVGVAVIRMRRMSYEKTFGDRH